MRDVDVARHPDPRAAPLRAFPAENERLDVGQVLASNGSTELIYQPGQRLPATAATAC